MKISIIDERELARLVKASTTYAQVIRGLGLVQSSGTHKKVKKAIEELGLDASHFKQTCWHKGKSFNPRGGPVIPIEDYLTKMSGTKRHFVTLFQPTIWWGRRKWSTRK